MIGYYLHHQGEGHRRRGTAVARSLRHPVTGLGTGGPPEGWPGDWLELAPDDTPEVSDPVAADVTAHGVLHWVPRGHAGLLTRQQQIVDWLAEARPELLVVDVSVEVALLARLCGVPVVVGAMPGRRTDRTHALAYDLAEALLAPWPADAHPDNGWPEHWLAKTWHVGGISALADQGQTPGPGGSPRAASPDLRPAATSADARPAVGSADARPATGTSDAPPPTPDGGRVLVLWGSGGHPLAEADLAAARAATPGWKWTVHGGGHPHAPDLLAALAAADVVVAHAGQGTVADLALAGRPAVVLPQERPYGEQHATGRALERLGLAVVHPGWPAPEDWPGLLRRAQDLGGDGWCRWRGHGAAGAAALLDHLADRLAGRPPVAGRPPDGVPSTLVPGPVSGRHRDRTGEAAR